MKNKTNKSSHRPSPRMTSKNKCKCSRCGPRKKWMPIRTWSQQIQRKRWCKIKQQLKFRPDGKANRIGRWWKRRKLIRNKTTQQWRYRHVGRENRKERSLRRRSKSRRKRKSWRSKMKQRSRSNQHGKEIRLNLRYNRKRSRINWIKSKMMLQQKFKPDIEAIKPANKRRKKRIRKRRQTKSHLV